MEQVDRRLDLDVGNWVVENLRPARYWPGTPSLGRASGRVSASGRRRAAVLGCSGGAQGWYSLRGRLAVQAHEASVRGRQVLGTAAARGRYLRVS